MIIDTLKNCEIYYGVHPLFEKAFDFIKKACAEKLPVGKYEIDGKNLVIKKYYGGDLQIGGRVIGVRVVSPNGDGGDK